MVKYDLDQLKLAKSVGVSQSYIAMLQRGQRGLSRVEAQRIYKVLNADILVDFLEDYPPYHGSVAHEKEQPQTGQRYIEAGWLNLISAYITRLRELSNSSTINEQNFIEDLKKTSNDLEDLVKKYSSK